MRVFDTFYQNDLNQPNKHETIRILQKKKNKNTQHKWEFGDENYV